MRTVTFNPKTHKLVPIEPTEDLVDAALASSPSRIFDPDNYPEEYDDMSGCQQARFLAARCYRAMIKSAPDLLE